MTPPADTPFLTREEQHALIAKAQAGDDAALSALEESHRPLVARIAAGYLGHCGFLEYRDLFQAGAGGLCAAVRKFDLATGNLLASYAERCIRNQIHDAIRDGQNFTPADWEKWVRMKRVAERIWTGENREAGCDEVAAETGIPEHVAVRLSNLFDAGYRIQAAEAPPDVEDLPAAADQQPDRLAARADDKNLVEACLPKLPEDERRAVVLHHGWTGEAEHTLAETAELMGLTKSQATELKNRGLQRLRRLMNVKLPSSR